MKRILSDEKTGEIFEIDESLLFAPPGPPPFRVLVDPKTGEEFNLSASLFQDAGQAPVRQDRAFVPPPTYQEKLISILLERCRISTPQIKEDIELLAGPLLAIGKISSKEEYNVIMLEIENLVRALYMSGAITSEDSVYLLDELSFFARWQARRSVTFDGKPNERELWTIQSIHQKSEVVQNEPAPGGLTAGLGKLFGRR